MSCKEVFNLAIFDIIPTESDKNMIKNRLTDLIEDNDSKEETSDPVITFGEDLDVPAFIRNRQE